MKKLFDEIPYMDHDRLVLKKLEETDSEALLELIRSDNVYRYLPSFLFERQFGDDMHEMIRELYFECFEQKESLILGVYLKDGMRFCGLAEYYGYKDAIHKTCLGYRLMESCWGQGIASETVAMMINYCFSQTDIEIITASTMIESRASARVLEKNGFIMTAHAVPEDWGYREPTPATNGSAEQIIDASISCRIRAEACVPSGMHT